MQNKNQELRHYRTLRNYLLSLKTDIICDELPSPVDENKDKYVEALDNLMALVDSSLEVIEVEGE